MGTTGKRHGQKKKEEEDILLRGEKSRAPVSEKKKEKN